MAYAISCWFPFACYGNKTLYIDLNNLDRKGIWIDNV